jgi:two-component system NarL family sensor kinase
MTALSPGPPADDTARRTRDAARGAPPPHDEPTRRRSRVISRAVLQFALTGLAALLMVGIGAILVIEDRSKQEAARDARQLTSAIGIGLVAPRLGDDLLAGDPRALDRLDRYLDTRIRTLEPSVVRIKLWDADGRIVYSDEPRLIGRTFVLDGDERAALTSGEVLTELSDLRAPENRYDRGNGDLLEVYLPLDTPSGERVLFELYLPYSAVAADAREIWDDFAPVLVAALLLLWLVQLPLAWSLARRLQRGQREREALLVRAMEASDSERRRIAGNLHDGVVQDMAGLSLTLAAAAHRTDDADVAPLLSGAARSTRQSIRQMRSLLVDIYPANLHTAGLRSVLEDLLAPLASRGLATHVAVEDDLSAAPEVEQLVYRTAQESLRNVLRHAGARSVELRAGRIGGIVELVVEDDGRGCPADAVRRARADGHLGLSMLIDRAATLGGDLTVDARPGRGTRVTLEVPAA